MEEEKIRVAALELAIDSLAKLPGTEVAPTASDITDRALEFECFLSNYTRPATTMPKKPEQPD